MRLHSITYIQSKIGPSCYSKRSARNAFTSIQFQFSIPIPIPIQLMLSFKLSHKFVWIRSMCVRLWLVNKTKKIKNNGNWEINGKRNQVWHMEQTHTHRTHNSNKRSIDRKNWKEKPKFCFFTWINWTCRLAPVSHYA